MPAGQSQLGSAPDPATAIRGRFDAVVEINRPICREHYLLRFRLAGVLPPTRPGQFIQVLCRPPMAGGGAPGDILGAVCEWELGQAPHLTQREVLRPLALLRRPFSLAGRGDGPDQGTWIEIVHRVVGTGTAWLAELKPGDRVDLLGPLGNAFHLPPGKSLALLVGGGVGLPPMFYLAQALHPAGWDAVAFVGAMTADLLAVDWSSNAAVDPHGQPTLCIAQFAPLNIPAVVTTNDGSRGLRALITTGLEHHLKALSPGDAARAVIFTCGPEKMMHAVAQLAQTHGVDCQVCLEQAMACGMGTCQSCIVKIDPRKDERFRHEDPQGTTRDGRPWRYKLACSDGPVFDAQAVVW